jgi:hypothetical protein
MVRRGMVRQVKFIIRKEVFMNKRIRDKRIVKIIKELTKQNGGFLKPKQIVDYARPKTSLLHKYFEWDDTEAAEKYRLYQARNLINVVVEVIPHTSTETRVMVSLRQDRLASSEGGYRVMTDVLSSKALSKIALKNAFDDLRTFKDKYCHLLELKKVIAAINEVLKKKKK